MSWFWPSKKEIKEHGEALVKSATHETPLGRIVPITPESKPEPDLSTKPPDIIGYCFGFACPKKHVQDYFESVTVDGYKERRACGICGAVAKPCVVKRTCSPFWGRDWRSLLGVGSATYEWITRAYQDYNWNRFEFFHYLETPKRRKK